MNINELGSLLLGIIVGAYLVIGLLAVTASTYKNGQIDAINGKLYYHLVIQKDKTSAWEKIK